MYMCISIYRYIYIDVHILIYVCVNIFIYSHILDIFILSFLIDNVLYVTYVFCHIV